MTSSDQAGKPVTAPVRINRPNPLTDTQRRSLDQLCDLMIPASKDGVMPAASSLGLFNDLNALTELQIQTLQNGLDALDEHSTGQLSTPFSDLAVPEANRVVDAVRPAQRGFFQLFTVQNVARYFEHDTVLPLIGLEARPPWPKGNQVEQGDWSLLDAVRQREPFYRKP